MSRRRWIALVMAAALATALGWWARGWLAAPPPSEPGAGEPLAAGGPCPGGAAPLYWRAPMDPSYVRDAPGKSPMGMDLVPECPAVAGVAAPGVVSVDPTMVQSIGVRTARVERRDLARTIRTVGRVDYDERLVSHVHTKVQGWVEKLYVEYEGQMVRRGQRLLEIYSPELVSAQEELLIAERYRRETSESGFPDVSQGGESLLGATRRRLELWDVPERDIERLLETGQIRKTLVLYAPTGGVVTHMMVRDGMEVGPNDNLYTIADLSRVWVYADVYEYELPWVAAGQRAAVELSYLPGVPLEGEVTYVYPFLEPKTRTARVRIELDNPEGVLRPDMYGNVTIETETRPGVLAIPDEALIRSGKRTLVVVALGDGRFEPRQVELGLDSGEGWLEVRGGLVEAEAIVTSGQFLIDSESSLQQAVQKLRSPPADEMPGMAPPQEGHEMPGMAPPQGGHEMPGMAPPQGGHEMPGMAPPQGGHEMPGMAPPQEGHEMPGMAPPQEGHEMPRDSGAGR